jgi:prophage maintenance system killer protein
MIIWLTLDNLLDIAADENIAVDRSVLFQVVNKCNDLANLADSSVAEIAAAYAYYLIVAEPPFEGNVIMADSASTNFLMLNEYFLNCQPLDLINIFRQVVIRNIGLRELTRWYSLRIKHFSAEDEIGESRLTEAEEGLSKEEFNNLKRGDIVFYSYPDTNRVRRGPSADGEYRITTRRTLGKSVFATFYFTARRTDGKEVRFHDWDRPNMSLPPVEREHVYTDVGPYEESRLTEEEEVSEDRWQEICRWAKDEWVGGGNVGTGGDSVTFYSSTGALWLKFHTYKRPEEPRMLYMIGLSSGSRVDFNHVFVKEEIPATLEDFISVYAEKKKEDPAYATPALALRTLRRQIKVIKAEKGYDSLVEVYAYVIDRLRAPVEREEVHMDTSEYGESYELDYEEMKEASAKTSAPVLRTLSLFLRFVKAFDPNFKDWADLGNVEITADHPVWKTGGGGILKVARDLAKKFPLTAETKFLPARPLLKPNGRWLVIERYTDIQKNIFKEIADRAKHAKIAPGSVYVGGLQPELITNLEEIRDWTGAVFLVDTGVAYAPKDWYNLEQATKTLYFRFIEPKAVPPVESLAGVHSFKPIAPGQVADVEIFTRTAEAVGLDNPVGRAAGIRQGAMGYATPEYEYLYFLLEDPGFKAAVKEAWEDFIRPLLPVEREAVYTDTGAYEEAFSGVSGTEGVALPERTEEVAEMARRWQEYPESTAKIENWGATFERLIPRPSALSSGKATLRILLGVDRTHVPVGAPAFCRLDLHPLQLNLTSGDLRSRGGSGDIPDDPEVLYARVVRYCREASDAFRRLKGVKPATAAHWAKQFLLGINLEKKVPEDAFPSAPIAKLPPFFAKFSSVAPVGENDLRLAIETDLTLIGE